MAAGGAMESGSSHPPPVPSTTQKWAEDGNAADKTENLTTYTFPRQRLKQVQVDPSREPLVLVACGSFSPITFLHLRLFEMAYDYIKYSTNFEVIGSYLSPVGDAYQKPGLATAQHRIRMCELVSRHSSSSRSIIEVDTWEAIQEEYQPTALVLDHFSREINNKNNNNNNNNNNNQGPESSTTNPRRPVRIALLAGADLLQSMNIPGIWSDESLRHIMCHYPLFIVERFGTDVASAKSQLDHRWKGDIHVIPQLIQNNVSSTMIRRFLQSGRSVRYLVPDEVLEYIEEQSLYIKPDR